MTDSTVIGEKWADKPFALLETPSKTSPTPNDNFVKSASEMCLVHNGIIRWLNSIYLQAPYIKSDNDKKDFVLYCQAWTSFLHAHHGGEEEIFFPKIEELAGVKGIMEKNVEQHHAFHDGLHEYDDYINALVKNPLDFDSAKLISIIDNFGSILVTHLHDEIPTLLALAEYRDTVDLEKLSQEEANIVMGRMDKWLVAPAFMNNVDATYEDGIHKSFPPVPWFVKLLAKYVWNFPNRRIWRFASCDRNGRPKKLGALPA